MYYCSSSLNAYDFASSYCIFCVLDSRCLNSAYADGADLELSILICSFASFNSCCSFLFSYSNCWYLSLYRLCSFTSASYWISLLYHLLSCSNRLISCWHYESLCYYNRTFPEAQCALSKDRGTVLPSVPSP